MTSDFDRLKAALVEAGVAGTEDLGRFVSNVQYFRASAFDERAAMPVLLHVLPALRERNVVTAVAGHLRRPWARPAAFEGLLDAFREWAPKDQSVGWALGDALATSADKLHVDILLGLAQRPEYGGARQMVVDSLWRYRKDERVPALLLTLIEDPDVSLHAMSALRRTIGNDAALPHLRRMRDAHPDERVRQQATRQVKRAEKAAKL